LILSTTLLKSRVGVGCGMVSRTWKPRSGSCVFRSLARPAPNAESSWHDHNCLGGLVGLIVDGDEIVDRGLGDDAEARSEPERVLQAAADDAVDHADINDIRQVVACRGLAGGKADATGIAADDRGDTGAIHLLDFGVAAFRRRLRVAQHRFELGAAERLDAAGGVDLLDRERRTDAALLARVGQRAGHRVQYADLHGGALRAQHARCLQNASGCGGAQRRGLQKTAAVHAQRLTRHWFPLWCCNRD
jgi:hypothetical protein